MIELITGKPGAGKSYLAVQRLLALDPGKYVVYHNIDGLKPEAFAESGMIRAIPEPVKEFLTKEVQTRYADAIREKYGRAMLVVIDEAGLVLAERDAAIKGWLSWHRHLGQDVWIVVQNSTMIHKDYVVLAEYEIRALKSTVLNLLVYQYRVGGEAFRTVRKKRDMKVYEAYKSFDVAEVRKAPSKLLWYSIGGIGVVAVLFYALLHSFGSPLKAKEVGAGVTPLERGSVPLVVPNVKGSSGANKKEEVRPEIGYVGVIGGKLLVQCRDQIMDYGECIQGRYGVLESGTSYAKVITNKGKQYVYRVKRQDQGSVPRDNSPGR